MEVHLIVDVKPDTRGHRTILTRCGQTFSRPMAEALGAAGLTGWGSLVTCGRCV